MTNLWRNIQKLAGWQKLVLGLMILLILLTWLAVCLILCTYLAS
jgi:hypothetical protein